MVFYFIYVRASLQISVTTGDQKYKINHKGAHKDEALLTPHRHGNYIEIKNLIFSIERIHMQLIYKEN